VVVSDDLSLFVLVHDPSREFGRVDD
jgi:hypothetical protein